MILKIAYNVTMRALFMTHIFLYLFLIFVQCKKPENRRLLATWRLECELGIVIDSDCPVDGGWSPWAPWSSCHGVCDNTGHRRRNRECNNPSPSKDGLPCNGFDEQIESCYLKNCSVEDYRALAKGNTARIEALRQLELIPAFMERCLQMECPYEAVEVALAAENTWQLNSEALWNALQCVKHDLGCSVNGTWGAWGPWSACTAQCGKGLRWRARRCDTPPPSASNLVCTGVPLQNKKCEGDQCAIDEHYSELSVSGTWSEWHEWTKCSEKCGPGIRRRRRTCIEKHISIASLTWTTHCHGPYEELEICNLKKCLLNGGWSGWGPWGPCSQICGAGKRSRTRSCTRPIPSGGGVNCLGPKAEVGSCHLAPCEGFSHTVAVFNGDSFLQYDITQKSSTFIHFYVRFMALSPRGTLLRQGTIQNPRILLSLHQWHVCLDACGSSKTCNLPRTCSPIAIEPSVWYTVLITVTNEVVTIRINDAPKPIQASFTCDPEFKQDKLNVFIGEKLQGQIQELILNFIPLNLFMQHEQSNRTHYFPTSESNIVYENANIKESYINLENEQYLRLPCFPKQDEWQLELSLKPKGENGIIIVLTNYNSDSWFYLMLQSMRLLIKFTLGEFKSEATSSIDYLPNQWIDIKINKRMETNTIEVEINSDERLHVLLADYSWNKQQYLKNKYLSSNSLLNSNSSDSDLNKNKCKTYSNTTIQRCFCSDEYFIGGIPLPLRNKVYEDFSPFFGTVASLKINNNLIDLHKINMERYKNEIIQVSSRTASVSRLYYEVTWGESNKLNLTCVHAKTTRYSDTAFWLFLDTVLENINTSSVDDGRVLRIVLTTDNNRPGFYTCRANDNDGTRNFITYGVLGRNHYKFTGPDMLTSIAVCTTVTLVIFTLSWLIKEGYHDIRDGYGFFRDDQLSSEEQENNINGKNVLVGDLERKINFVDTKPRRRRKRRHVQALLETSEILNRDDDNDFCENTQEEPDTLPVQTFQSFAMKPSHEIYRCEPSYVSSPLLSSNVASVNKKMSASSINTSPTLLCSHLLMTNPKRSKKSNVCSSMLSTVKSSSLIHNSPAQIVLKKFQKLKTNDS